GELRRTLLKEGVDALPEVIRLRRCRLELRLALELLVQRVRAGLVEEPFGHPHAACRHLRELGSMLGCASGQTVAFDDLGDETPGLRFGSRELPARGHPLERA